MIRGEEYGLLFGLPKRAAKKFATASQRGAEKTAERLKKNDPSEYDKVKNYIKSDRADKLYRKTIDGISWSATEYL